MSNFYTDTELQNIGFKSVGKNVFISKKASIYGPEKISIGNNVRIDDFCILSGNISIGSYVHISAYCALYGRFGIHIGNFCGLSARSIIYSASDDFSGEFMISPMVPDELTKLDTGTVIMMDYSQLGANTIVMPGVTIAQGAVTGTLSLVRHDLAPWTINVGIPCRLLQQRKQNIIALSKNIAKELG
ncbi:MAG: acyltransferase [Muribaculaceae bacterium]|nr:acyltransferase [Muribaculaceae bacterium]